MDLTRVATTDPIEGFLYEEIIELAGIDAYKVYVHQRFVRGWAVERGLDVGHVWRVREECIVALSELDVA